MPDDRKERIPPHGYSVTVDEKRYLRCLCAGPNDAHKIADEVAADLTVSKDHRADMVAARFAYLARYGGTEHLVERDGDRYAPTDADRVDSTRSGRADFDGGERTDYT